jgi:hypothetical protein
MRFWDASAIVPLVVAEATTKELQGLAAADPAMLRVVGQLRVTTAGRIAYSARQLVASTSGARGNANEATRSA